VGGLRRARRALKSRGALAPHPQTLAWRSFTTPHPDGWAGPHVVLPFQRPAGDRAELAFEGDAPIPVGGPLVLSLAVPGAPTVRLAIEKPGAFRTMLAIDHLPAGDHELDVEASGYFVPHDLSGNGDYRPLSFRLTRLQVESAETASSERRS
jgi:hypothetical protein